jgi:hypothetical protein
MTSLNTLILTTANALGGVTLVALLALTTLAPIIRLF